MSIMSNSELERLQDDIEAFTLPDTCNILSLTRTSDGQGGWTDGWGTASADVKCRVDGIVDTVARESVKGASLRDYTRWIITLPHDTTIQVDWRIEHSDHTYAIVTMIEDTSWAAHVRATMERL